MFLRLCHFGPDEEATPDKQWYGFFSFVIGELNARFFLLHCHTKQKIGMGVAKTSATCRQSQSHYFHCLCTSPSGGGASLSHALTTRWAFVLSRLRRKRWWYLLSLVPKEGYVIVPVDQYSWLDNVPGGPSQYIVIHSDYIVYVLLYFLIIHSYLWYKCFIWYHFSFIRPLLFLLRVYFILSYSMLYLSFNNFFILSDHFSSRVLFYTIF